MQNSNVSQGDAPIGHHDHHVSQAQFETGVPADTEDDDLSVEMPSAEQGFDRNKLTHPAIIPDRRPVCTRALAPQFELERKPAFRRTGRSQDPDTESIEITGERPAPPPPPGLDDALQELGIYTFSTVMRNAAASAAVAAESDAPVLLQGETGTGKEIFAKLIHRMSLRRKREMVTINCAGIPKDLAESLLFGHVKGAFTGSHRDQIGKFEQADGSTLFLDELAELTLDLQAKLLKVVEDFHVEPLGANALRKVDVRIVAATNQGLMKAVAEGRFREDLYYRLRIFPITLPPLRDRQGEILQLAVALLRRINQRYRRQRQLSKEALHCLEQHDWPGNVRELAGVLERSVFYSSTDILGPKDILIDKRSPQDAFDGLPELHQGFSLEEFLAQIRRKLIYRALEKSGGNQSTAAELLGISKQAINNFLRTQPDNAA